MLTLPIGDYIGIMYENSLSYVSSFR